MRDGQTSPHSPWIVISRNTCPPLSPSPHATSILGTVVINTNTSPESGRSGVLDWGSSARLGVQSGPAGLGVQSNLQTFL